MIQDHSFHLSIEVWKYQESIHFYTQVLAGILESENDSWCNINFYGHQLTLHKNQEASLLQVKNFHWGINTNLKTLLETYEILKSSEVEFVKAPKDFSGEKVKMIFRDPNGYLLEFKASTRKKE